MKPKQPFCFTLTAKPNVTCHETCTHAKECAQSFHTKTQAKPTCFSIREKFNACINPNCVHRTDCMNQIKIKLAEPKSVPINPPYCYGTYDSTCFVCNSTPRCEHAMCCEPLTNSKQVATPLNIAQDAKDCYLHNKELAKSAKPPLKLPPKCFGDPIATHNAWCKRACEDESNCKFMVALMNPPTQAELAEPKPCPIIQINSFNTKYFIVGQPIRVRLRNMPNFYAIISSVTVDNIKFVNQYTAVFNAPIDDYITGKIIIELLV